MNRAPTAPEAAPEAVPGGPRTPSHGVLPDDGADAHEHGERASGKPREESLIGTAGSHTPAPDTRAEEPFGDLEGAEVIP